MESILGKRENIYLIEDGFRHVKEYLMDI